MIVQAFYEHLAADAGIAALVSGKIYPFIIPQGQDAPAITYSQQSDAYDQLLTNTGTIKWALFDIDCWAFRYEDAIAAADAVESACVNYRGRLGTVSPSISADHIRLERRGPDLFENPTELYRVPLQLFVGYYTG